MFYYSNNDFIHFFQPDAFLDEKMRDWANGPATTKGSSPVPAAEYTALSIPRFGEVMAEKVTLMTVLSLLFHDFLFKHPHKSSMPIEEFLLKAMDLLGVI